MRSIGVPSQRAETCIRSYNKLFEDTALAYEESSPTKELLLKTIHNTNSNVKKAFRADHTWDERKAYSDDSVWQARLAAYFEFVDDQGNSNSVGDELVRGFSTSFQIQ